MESRDGALMPGSSLSDIEEHEAFKSIVAMGQSAIHLNLYELS